MVTFYSRLRLITIDVFIFLRMNRRENHRLIAYYQYLAIMTL